jgi:hypothetical protein
MAVCKLDMKQTVLGWALALPTFVLGCSTPQAGQPPAASSEKLGQSPFVISVVPFRSYDEPVGREITMAKKSPGSLYVILMNVSKEPQEAFETWNSWGYQAISFEIQTADSRTVAISKKRQDFTVNGATTFFIPPGEHMVYPISLDETWDAVPPLPMADETPGIPITIKAIYEVRPTPESARLKVWTGRLESNSYHFKFRHR